MKTIVGLYDNMKDAEKAITALVQAGFDRADISLMAADQGTGESGAAAVYGGTTTGDAAVLATWRRIWRLLNPFARSRSTKSWPYVSTRLARVMRVVTPIETNALATAGIATWRR